MVIQSKLFILTTCLAISFFSYGDSDISIGNLDKHASIKLVGEKLCRKYNFAEVSEPSFDVLGVQIKANYSVYEHEKKQCSDVFIEFDGSVNFITAQRLFDILSYFEVDNLRNFFDSSTIENSSSFAVKSCEDCIAKLESIIEVQFFDGRGKYYDEYDIYYKRRGITKLMNISVAKNKIVGIKVHSVL